MEDILIGVTDRTIPVFIPDPASTTGAGKTGLAAAAVTVTYTRYETDNDVVHTDATSSVNDLSALTDAHNDWGWKEVSSTLSKGQYRLDIADAVFASGAWYAVVQVTITSGTAAATPKAFRLISRNDLTDIAQTGDGYAIVNSGTHGNAALKTLIDAVDTVVDTILVDTNELQADWTDGGRLDLLIDSIISKVDTVDDFLDTEIAAILAAVDTEVAAIKTKTDSLTFTVANVVDANIQRINDVTVLGDGAGTPWGP